MATNTIDPTRQGRYNLKIGESLTGPSGNAAFSSVRFNYKPQIVSRSTNLDTSSHEPKLHIQDTQDRAYDYDGSRAELEETYALIFNNQDQTCTLERVGHQYDFNLASASHDKDLADRFPPLSLVDSDGAHTEGSTASVRTSLDTGPDASNPFDFRHFLAQQQNGRDASPSPSPQPSPPQRPAVIEKRPVAKSTPQTNPLKKTAPKQLKKVQPRELATPKEPVAPIRSRAATSKPAPKPAAPKAKAAPKSAEFVHDSSSSSPEATAGAARPDPEDEEDEESASSPPRRSGYGGLEIDFGDDSPPRPSAKGGGLEIDFGEEVHPRKKAMSLLYGGSAGSKRGPISLRSAANSPNPSAMAAASRKHHQPDEINLSFDFGGEDADDDQEAEDEQEFEEVETSDRRGHDGQDHSEDEDVDVEPMHIGSPAHVQRTASMAAAEGDDFEAQMLQALADEGDEDPYAGHADESEESEAD